MGILQTDPTLPLRHHSSRMGHRINRRIRWVLPVLSMLFVASCSSEEGSSTTANTAEHLRPEIVERHPFDDTSFTQGLEVDANGELLVGTGRYGQSRIYRTAVDSEEQDNSHDLDDDLFGEGITRFGDTVWQLTWHKGTAIKRDAQTLEERERAQYDGEGWGLCASDDALLRSDGSSRVYRHDPETFELIDDADIEVTHNGEPINNINELECVGDNVYANIFLTTEIIRFSAETGEVNAVIDASGLENNAADDPDHVLNGIAFDPDSEHFYLTGKHWPDLYEVEFVSAD